MDMHLLVLPGDGIGPEVTAEALRVLEAVALRFGHRIHRDVAPIGGASLRDSGQPVTAATLAAARAADAVLLGAVGDPEFEQRPPSERPEQGLLSLRTHLEVYANLRPVKVRPCLHASSPLKADRLAGTDLMIVRELTGGLYFGEPRHVVGQGRSRRAVNTLCYSCDEISRVARVAFEQARARRGKVTSVDKANVLETSQLWREVVTEVATEYPEVTLEHLFVDNAAMQLVLAPTTFDVVLTDNLFGDILSDEAAVLSGSIGLLASASLGAPREAGRRPGLYEPIHGSAPTLAGRGLANPLGTIGSVAMMLAASFGLEAEAQAVEAAVDQVLVHGPRTPDLGGTSGTEAVGRAVAEAVLAPVAVLS